MREWFESSAADKLETLQNDPEVIVLLFYNDGVFTTLDGLKIVRSPKLPLQSKFSRVYQNEIVGAVDKSSSFQLCSLPTDIATSSFFSYFPFDKDGDIPYGI